MIEVLNEFGVKHKVVDTYLDSNVHLYTLEFSLFEDNPRFSAVREGLASFELQAQVFTVYERKDYEDAEWFMISTSALQYPQPESNYKTIIFDSAKYCVHCGMEKRQIKPFRLNSIQKKSNRQFWGLHWEYDAIFVSSKAKKVLETETFSGLKFMSTVLDKNEKVIDGNFQLFPENTLNHGFDPYNTKAVSCRYHNEEGWHSDPNHSYCGRVKYQYPRLGGFLFREEIFNKTWDIAQTYEYFGSGSTANKITIVSKKFKEVVESNLLKGLDFSPVSHTKLSIQ